MRLFILRVGMHGKVWLPCGYHCFFLLFKCGYRVATRGYPHLMPSKKCGYQSNSKHQFLMKYQCFYVLILRVGMHGKVWLPCGYHCFLPLFKCGYRVATVWLPVATHTKCLQKSVATKAISSINF